MGWSVGRGCPLPTEENFFWFNVFKKFLCSDHQRGGASPSGPLNTPLDHESNKKLSYSNESDRVCMYVCYVCALLSLIVGPADQLLFPLAAFKCDVL